MKLGIIFRWIVIIYMTMFVCCDLYVIFNSDYVTQYGWDTGQLALLWFFGVIAGVTAYVAITSLPKKQ